MKYIGYGLGTIREFTVFNNTMNDLCGYPNPRVDTDTYSCLCHHPDPVVTEVVWPLLEDTPARLRPDPLFTYPQIQRMGWFPESET